MHKISVLGLLRCVSIGNPALVGENLGGRGYVVAAESPEGHGEQGGAWNWVGPGEY